MDDMVTRLRGLGVSLHESPAEQDYARATSIDELLYSAGEQLALHAVSICMSLNLPRRGAIPLRIMRRAAPSRWREYWQLNNDAFCHAAFIDLCTVREFAKTRPHRPRHAELVDQAFVMACIYRARAIEMAPDEKGSFLTLARNRLIEFQDHPSSEPESYLNALIALPGVVRARIDRARMIKSVFAEPSWVDPAALLRHYERISATSAA